MKKNITLTVSPPMEFLYCLFALGTDKSFFEMIRGFDLEPNDAITDALQDLRTTLSRYIQQELKYFFDISGLGYIFYKYVVKNPQLSSIAELLELFNHETANDFVFKMIQSVCKNTLPNQETAEFAQLKGNTAELLKLLDKTPFQDEQRRFRVLEAVQNPEEIKLRFYLLLSQFYTCSFKASEGKIMKLIEREKEKYEQKFEENPEVFLKQYVGLESLKKDDVNYLIHLSFFKYVGCHGFSSYSPSIADWFVLGVYTDLLFNENIVSEKQANFFKILSDVNRIAILRLLSERSWFGQELAEKLNISPPTVSYHIGFLQQIGAVSFIRTDNRFYYSLDRSKLITPLKAFIESFNNNEEAVLQIDPVECPPR